MDLFSMGLFMGLLPKSTKKKLLNPSADAIGRSLGSLFNIILSPLLKAGIYRKTKLRSYAIEINKNLSNIPLKDRSKRELDTSVKIMDQSRYCINNNVLRKCFAQLLASSVDSRKNEHVSNYFPTVLSNMNASDACFLARFKGSNSYPLANIKIDENMTPDIIRPALNGYVNWSFNDSSKVNVMYQNNEINFLRSFGIVDTNFNSEILNHKHAYSDIKKNCHVFINKPQSLILKRGVLKLTDMGKDFITSIMPVSISHRINL